MFPTLRQRARQALTSRLTAAHIAGGLLIIASGLSNALWGFRAGSNEFEQAIGVTAAIAADCWSAVGFIVMAAAASRKRWGQATAAGIMLAFTLTYATIAGLSFATQTSEARLAPRRAAERTDTLRSGELKELSAKLALSAPTRAAGELQAELDKILSDKKAGGCQTMNGPYTREQCPRYFQLKAEHSRAVERQRLETARQDILAKLQTVERVEASDPFEKSVGTYLAFLHINLPQGSLIPWTSLLFVLLIVLGGPIILWLAESRRHIEDDITDREHSQQTPTDGGAENNRQDGDKNPRKFTKLPITPDNSNEPSVRGRRRSVMTPVASRTLTNLKRAGGSVNAKSQNELAIRLGVPRTSFRRVIDQLEESGMITTSHGAEGYNVALAA